MSIDNVVFPQHVMGGLALDYANLRSEGMESPLEFWYFNFLTCMGNFFANRVRLLGELRNPPRLYLINLGTSSDSRKSTAMKYTVSDWIECFPEFRSMTCYGVNSAEGLRNVLKRSNITMLYFDEFQYFIKKSSINGSALCDVVTSLFSDNISQVEKEKKSIMISDAHLSLLGACTYETYKSIYSSEFLDIGFPNRVFIVPATSNKTISIPVSIAPEDKIDIYTRLRLINRIVGDGIEIPVNPGALEIYDKWYKGRDRSISGKRLDEYAIRFMLLYSLNEFKWVVNEEITSKVIDLIEWERKMRVMYDPISADNSMAKMEQTIRNLLLVEPRKDRVLKQYTNAYRYGLWVYKTAKQNLIDAGEIGFDNDSKLWYIIQE